jgi:uncharacterized protein (DUF885 family)
MKRFVLAGLLSFFLLFSLTPRRVFAITSDRAYQDYLYQFDVYRQKYNEFIIARNEYLKFKTLTSQSAAITKSREMMSQRAQLLRAYLLMLEAKIPETPELTKKEQELFRAHIFDEVSFLENHSQFVKSIQSIQDALKASNDLESHYVIMQQAMRQMTLGISLAKLRGLGEQYSNQLTIAKSLIDEAKPTMSLDQQAVIDRWFLQISNKRTLFLQKIDSLTNAIGVLKQEKIDELDIATQQIQKELTEGQKELVEGESFMTELMRVLSYKE